MKKQALSLFLAGALALSLFGCSAQPAAESAPQSSPAETAGSSSAGVVEELHLGTTAANDTFTTFVESGAFGKMCYNSFVTAPFWQTGPNGEVSVSAHYSTAADRCTALVCPFPEHIDRPRLLSRFEDRRYHLPANHLRAGIPEQLHTFWGQTSHPNLYSDNSRHQSISSANCRRHYLFSRV